MIEEIIIQNHDNILSNSLMPRFLLIISLDCICNAMLTGINPSDIHAPLICTKSIGKFFPLDKSKNILRNRMTKLGTAINPPQINRINFVLFLLPISIKPSQNGLDSVWPDSSAKRVWSPRHPTFTSPVGPLLCLAMMICETLSASLL